MIVSVSVVIVLGALVVWCSRKDGLKISHALVCGMFGFCLSSTAVAPSIQASGESLATLLGGISLCA